MPLVPVYVLSALTGVGIGIATPLIPFLITLQNPFLLGMGVDVRIQPQ